MQRLKAIIDIVVCFGSDSVKPLCFKYAGVKKDILNIKNIWDERKGLHRCRFFLCQINDVKLAEIRWDMEDENWYLEKY